MEILLLIALAPSKGLPCPGALMGVKCKLSCLSHSNALWLIKLLSYFKDEKAKALRV